MTTMLRLPQCTLICLTNKDFGGHKKALDKSCEGIEWGAVKLIWDEKITGIDSWNYKMIYELHNYVQTDFAMVIHADSWVTNPECWEDEFLAYDFIGSPWPLPRDNYSYRTPDGELVRVGNSVSIRSKRIMELPSELALEFKPFYGNTNEDGKLCVEWRDILRQHGIKYAPFDLALRFGKEAPLPENEGKKSFVFHHFE